MRQPMMRARALLFALAAFAIVVPDVGVAQKQECAEAVDFTVQLFLESKGQFSPDIFKIEEFGVFNFTFQGKDIEGGKFSGFFVRVELRAPREVFAPGRQAQLVIRDRKNKKVLRTWNISDVYVGDSGVTYRGFFVSGLDCTPMEMTLLSGKTKITRDLSFQCGE